MNPHLSQPVVRRGCAPETARVFAIMVHGRARDTGDILSIADRLDLPEIAYLAPAACENSWYPNRFMERLELNQPHLDQALERVGTLVEELTAMGIDTRRIVLIGFSQGACVVSEYAVRNARRYGGIIAFTGGVIGPPGTHWDYPGRFDGTPILLGTSAVDEWVPVARVQETADLMRRMGAEVEEVVYQGMEHFVNDDEIARARNLIRRAMDTAGKMPGT